MSCQWMLASVPPVAHDLLVLSGVIVAGLALGQVRVAGVRLGVAGVLFAGLAAAHFGMGVQHEVAHFLKDFGLVLFVFSLGMQMGPGFFFIPGGGVAAGKARPPSRCRSERAQGLKRLWATSSSLPG